MKIQYTKGDATQPKGSNPRVIIHCCNDIGGWGRGFVLALSKRWPHVEAAYREWASLKTTTILREDVSTTGPFELGEVQFVLAEEDIWVANLIGQHDIRWENGRPPIRYDAIITGLQEIWAYLDNNFDDPSVHMPRMGAGFAGGDWAIIEKMIQEELCDWGIPVTVYDLP